MSHQLLILYGTETGNSQDAAKRIRREAVSYGLTVKVQSLHQYDVLQLLHERRIVFVIATTGQGDVPQKAKEFWKVLFRKNLPLDALLNVQCGVFGLGDSAYVKFNVVAKKLHNRLAGLGARMMLDRGLGDDQAEQGYETALEVWLCHLWNVLNTQLKMRAVPQLIFDLKPFVIEPISSCVDVEHEVHWFKDSIDAARRFYQLESSEETAFNEEQPRMEYPFYAKLLKNERITSERHFQDTRHIKIDIKGSGFHFSPGDVLCMHPMTSWKAIDAFLTRLKLNPHSKVRIHTASNPQRSEEFCLRSLIQGVLDVDSASPRRFFFEMLSHYATEPREKERLSHFASGAGQEELSLYNKQSGRTVLDILKDFSSTDPPLEWILDAIPRKIPRKFSIASSMKAFPNEIELIVAIVAYKTKTHCIKFGLCSSYLASLDPSHSDAFIACWIEKGSLSFPLDATTASIPLILVGPGTGIAPIRSFLQERQKMGLKSASCLFFGCRNEKEDFYFREELENFSKMEILDRAKGLITAFSRDQKEKIYVTQRMLQNGFLLNDMIMNKNSSIFISGSAKKMPQDVHQTFIQILNEHSNLSSEQSEQILKNMDKEARYQIESWS